MVVTSLRIVRAFIESKASAGERCTRMDRRILAEVEKLLRNASIASVRSWFKGQGKKLSARTRERMNLRVAAFIEKGEITFGEIEDGIAGIEEAGGKLILLYHFKERKTVAEIKTSLTSSGITIGSFRKMAALNPPQPALVYAKIDGDNVRVKWGETHQKAVVNYENNTVTYEPVTKVIVLTANLKTKKVEIRYDRPETIHPHSAIAKAKSSYFDHYRQLSENILDVKLIPSELHKALKELIEESPSLVRLHRGGHLNERNNYFAGTLRTGNGDIREDPEYKAMYAKTGNAWSYEDQSFYWKPDQSAGKLTREVFSHIDAVTPSVRVEADCWDAEVEYAIKKIRDHE